MQSHGSCKIYLAGRNHNNESVVTSDSFGICHHINSLKFHKRIAVKPGEQLRCSQGVGCQRFPKKNPFPSIGDSPTFYQIHHRIRKKRRMDAQMFFFSQMKRHGLKQGTYGKCQTAPILNDGCHIGAHLVVHLIYRPPGEINGWFRGIYQKVKIIHMNKGIAKSPGRPLIHFAYDNGSLFHRLSGHIYGGAETAVPLPVRGGNLDKRRINSDLTGLNQGRNARKTCGNQINSSFGDGLARQPARKKCFQPELMGVLFRYGYGLTEADQLYKFQISQVAQCGSHETFHQGAGFRDTCTQKNTHSRFYLRKHFLSGYPFCSPVHFLAIEH